PPVRILPVLLQEQPGVALPHAIPCVGDKTVGLEAGDPVMAAAQVFVDQDAAAFEAQPGVVIASSEITSLELEARWRPLSASSPVALPRRLRPSRGQLSCSP
ncbi:hypothetical protein NE579_16270, partial [Intestinimonas massiliensis]